MADKVAGVLKNTRKGAGVLRDPARSFRATPAEITVPSKLVARYGLVEGALVRGTAERKRRGSEMIDVESVCDLDPEEFRARLPYTQLTTIHPQERFNLAASGNKSMRIVDLVAPIGKGTRGLIVSPPKAGKTMLLQSMARAIRQDSPETRIIVLLIDERPEEVTEFRRSVDAEVLASSNDQSAKEHVELAELTMAHIRIDLECGRDVVVLVDSITRMGRAFNLRGPGSGRTLSGGMEAGAMEIPRRFFGLARNIEGGGSVTIIATALVDTGSRMDQVIFEEFKGTGNSEIILDRQLADMRIYPAIDVAASGSRREEELYGEKDIIRINRIRAGLAGRSPREGISMLHKFLEKYPTNEELLASIPAD